MSEMDNQQLFGVYVSCECNKRLYIGHTSKIEDESYLGSFRDKTFNPSHKFFIHFTSVRIVSLIMETNFQRCFNAVFSERFANRAIVNTDASFGILVNNKGRKFTEEHKQK